MKAKLLGSKLTPPTGSIFCMDSPVYLVQRQLWTHLLKQKAIGYGYVLIGGGRYNLVYHPSIHYSVDSVDNYETRINFTILTNGRIVNSLGGSHKLVTPNQELEGIITEIKADMFKDSLYETEIEMIIVSREHIEI